MLRGLSPINRFYMRFTSNAPLIYPSQLYKVGFLPSRSIHNTRFLKQLETNSDAYKVVKFKIRRNNIADLIDESTIIKSSIELDDLELCIAEEKLILNLTWLRDSCHCVLCTHPYSRQRLLNAKDFRREMFSVSKIHLIPEGCRSGPQLCLPSSSSNDSHLSVKWNNGHESIYSLNWLRYINNLYHNESQLNLKSRQRLKFDLPEDDFYFPTKNNCLKPEYWNVSVINSKLTPINYQDLVDGFKFDDDVNLINANRTADMNSERFNAMCNLSHQLVTLGIAKITNVPRERNQVLKVARSLAYERPTGYGVVFDVVVEPNEEINLAYSSLEFDLHSDLTYRETSPGVQLLHCITNSTEGGMSYFSDSFNAAQILQQTDPMLFEVLLQFPATFVVRDPYRNVKFRRQQQIITLDYQGNLSDVYYSPFMLPPIGFKDDVKLFYLAIEKFTQILQSKENKVIAKMESGDLFIFHNRRVLHGRSAYDTTTSNRFLQGCYMDWDEIKCLHEKLHAHKYMNFGE